MEGRPVRLGWLSLLLTVILICLATLAVLGLSTARADLAMAHRQAQQVSAAYALEAAGQQWLAALGRALQQAGGGGAAALDPLLPPGTVRSGNTLSTRLEGEAGRSLAIEVELTGAGGYRVTRWQQAARWQGEETEEEAPLLFGV